MSVPVAKPMQDMPETGADILEIPVQQRGLAASVERHLRDYFAAHENGFPASGLYDRILQEIERPLLSVALAECQGNQLRAAELLGLNRNTLRKKIRELGLEPRRGRKNRKLAAND